MHRSGIKLVTQAAAKAAVAVLSQTFVPGLGYDGWKQGGRNSTMIEFKGSHFERDVILWGVRWYVAYSISYRQLEECVSARGFYADRRGGHGLSN